MSKKFVYMFCEGSGSMRELLGGKGANLAEMMNLGMPVPNGFTITTEACTDYYDNGESVSDEIQAQIYEYVWKTKAAKNSAIRKIRCSSASAAALVRRCPA